MSAVPMQADRRAQAAALAACAEQTLVLSTAHVEQSTGQWIEADLPNSDGLMVGADWQYGWMLYTGNHEGPIPQEPAHVLKTAHEHGYEWVRFDCDAPRCEALPVFDWA